MDVVLIVENEEGMQKLLESNFQIGADTSAAAGPVERHAEAGSAYGVVAGAMAGNELRLAHHLAASVLVISLTLSVMF